MLDTGRWFSKHRDLSYSNVSTLTAGDEARELQRSPSFSVRKRWAKMKTINRLNLRSTTLQDRASHKLCQREGVTEKENDQLWLVYH